jgi:hypothetical protein
MNLRLTLILFFLLVSLFSFSQISLQDKNRNLNRNNFYLELGGSAYYYSANYELLLVKSSATALFGRIGLEYLPIRDADRMIHFPLAANLTIGKKRSKLEIGMGALFRLDFSPNNVGGEGYYLTDPPTRIFMAPFLGWRWHSKPNEYGEQFLLRVGFTPLLGMNVFTNTPFMVPWGGVSIGRTWQNNWKKREPK